ncbi:MAG TPA: hypothetical protein VJW75_10825 [Candidatus Eisenbacteria bacterium]|nr:hypothetical protein [Candidatus Eisenbacteria bacterium]
MLLLALSNVGLFGGSEAAKPSPPGAAAKPSPPGAAPQKRQAQHRSLEAARDSIEAMLRRALDFTNPNVQLKRETTRFSYVYAQAETSGLALRLDVRDSTTCPVDTLEKMLEASGWTPDLGYSADGPDGHTMGFVRGKYFCLVEAQWDGGDPTDLTYVPEVGCRLNVTCAPRRSDDIPPQ